MLKIGWTSDGSIKSSSGDYMFVSQDRFLQRVVNERACFICTEPITEEAKEHIIPRWLQKHTSIYSDEITLPNGKRQRYDKYVVPCCKNCNGLLGKKLEDPIARVITRGYGAFSEFAKNNPSAVFAWLNLLVLKTHLKDLWLRENVDYRVQSGMIAERYDWLALHHTYSVARSPVCSISVADDVIGTILLFQVSDCEKSGRFDYRDHYWSDTVYLRVDDIGIISVLNDSGKVSDMIDGRIPLSEPPNLIQVMEILTECQAANMHLLSRPTYGTVVDTEEGKAQINAFFPDDIKIAPFNAELFGGLFWMNLQDFKSHKNQHGQALAEQELDIKAGKVTFLPLKMAGEV